MPATDPNINEMLGVILKAAGVSLATPPDQIVDKLVQEGFLRTSKAYVRSRGQWVFTEKTTEMGLNGELMNQAGISGQLRGREFGDPEEGLFIDAGQEPRVEMLLRDAQLAMEGPELAADIKSTTLGNGLDQLMKQWLTTRPGNPVEIPGSTLFPDTYRVCTSVDQIEDTAYPPQQNISPQTRISLNLEGVIPDDRPAGGGESSRDLARAGIIQWLQDIGIAPKQAVGNPGAPGVILEGGDIIVRDTLDNMYRRAFSAKMDAGVRRFFEAAAANMRADLATSVSGESIHSPPAKPVAPPPADSPISVTPSEVVAMERMSATQPITQRARGGRRNEIVPPGSDTGE